MVHGDLSAAVAGAGKARAEVAANSHIDPSWQWRYRLLEADALLKQERMEDVVSRLSGDTFFPATGDLAIKRNLILSRAHHYLDRAQDSDRELQEARRLAESSHSPLIGDVLRSEALAERDAGHWKAALDKLDASLAVARQHGDRWLEALDLVSLGFIDLQNEHYDQAALLSRQAVNAAQSLQARAQIQQGLGNLGWAYYNLGDFDGALVQFQEAERRAREVGNATFRVRWLQDAGLAQYKLGNLADARHSDEQALEAATSMPAAESADLIANIESNLALLLVQQRDYDAAKLHSDRAADAARQSKDVNVAAYATLTQALVATRQPGAEDAERLYLQAHRTTTDQEIRMSVENALANLYRGRRQSRDAESWYRWSIQTFEERRATVTDEAMRLPAFAYGESLYRDYAEFLIDSRRPLEALHVLDDGRARTLAEGLGYSGAQAPSLGAAGLDFQRLARQLDAPILFYSLGPAKSHVWVVTGRETRVFDLAGQQDIRSQVEEYQRSILKSGDPLRAGSVPAQALYESLVRPAAAMIPPGARVYVIPDGILHGLNFETLIRPVGSGFKYWIEDVTVITASSIRLLTRPREAMAGSPGAGSGGGGGERQDLLLIGDPVKASSEFEPLPNAADEMRRVLQHFDGMRQTVWGQARAVPSAYTSGGPERYRYVHFVAHGTASRSSPLDSAVILSPMPGKSEEFKLYARDVVRHPLTARLVTISACYGAGVRTYAGEGMVGLAWAFLRAGAHNVIGTLWQADDGATPLLMDHLYAELQAGAAPEAALRSAKLALIHSPSVYRKPLYWGAFQLYAGS